MHIIYTNQYLNSGHTISTVVNALLPSCVKMGTSSYSFTNLFYWEINSISSKWLKLVFTELKGSSEIKQSVLVY